ncbi:MAG: hypothetical protein K2X44_03510 [Magnetospirillum sp.]|nr:hypothetical protein [Magnetospirillum sp.]
MKSSVRVRPLAVADRSHRSSPFPAELRDAETLVQQPPAPVPAPVTGIGLAFCLGVAMAARRIAKRRRLVTSTP